MRWKKKLHHIQNAHSWRHFWVSPETSEDSPTFIRWMGTSLQVAFWACLFAMMSGSGICMQVPLLPIPHRSCIYFCLDRPKTPPLQRWALKPSPPLDLWLIGVPKMISKREGRVPQKGLNQSKVTEQDAECESTRDGVKIWPLKSIVPTRIKIRM